MTCHTCIHCKARVGLLKRWSFCTRFKTPAHKRCADYRQRGSGHGA